MMRKLRFTIITVCFNAQKYIGETINSVLKQDFDDYEYIIKDGGSTDNTLYIVNSYIEENKKINFISEKDNGIYDAMNCALNQAGGEYIFFLNAGDCLCNLHVLSKVNEFINQNEADVVYGNTVQIENCKRNVRNYGKIYGKKVIYLVGDCICHQALFGKRELFEQKKFDLKYSVCADREWELFWLDKGAMFLPMHFEVSEVLTEGFSRDHVKEYDEEVQKCINLYFPKVKWIYRIITIIKINRITLYIIRKIENIFLKSNYM